MIPHILVVISGGEYVVCSVGVYNKIRNWEVLFARSVLITERVLKIQLT
jgi:hypothetical protein